MLSALLLSVATAFGATAQPLVIHGKHVFWGLGVASPPSANNLIYHGGAIETPPATYAVFWGPAEVAGGVPNPPPWGMRLLAERSEEHTSELQSPWNILCRLLLVH